MCKIGDRKMSDNFGRKGKDRETVLEHARRICAHQATEPVTAFVQQRYYVIGLRKALLSIKYRCFLCRRLDSQNIQPIIAPLPAFRFPTEEKISVCQHRTGLFWPVLH